MEKKNFHVQDVTALFQQYANELKILPSASNGKNCVFLIGSSGSAKSCCANIACDNPLEVKNGNIVLVNPQMQNAFAIGAGIHSQTFLPQFADIDNGNYRLFDFCGFGDTRGALHSLINASLLLNLFKQARSVRIIFVTSQDEILASRGVIFNETVKIMKNLLPGIQNVASMSGLIITRSIGNINPNLYMQYLESKVEEKVLRPWFESKQWASMTFAQLIPEEIKNIKQVLFVNNGAQQIQQVNIDVILRNVERESILEFYHQVATSTLQMVTCQMETELKMKQTKEEIRLHQQYIENKMISLVEQKFQEEASVQMLKPVTQNVLQQSWERFQSLIQLEQKKLMAQCQTKIQEDLTREMDQEMKNEKKQKEEAQKLTHELKQQTDFQTQLIEQKEKEILQVKQEKESLTQQFAQIESQIAQQQIQMQGTMARLQQELLQAMADREKDDDTFLGIKLGGLRIGFTV